MLAGALGKSPTGGTWEMAGRAVQGRKGCLLSRHLATVYFTNMFTHWKWVEEVFSGDLLILVRILPYSLHFGFFYFEALETNYQYTNFISNIKPTLDITMSQGLQS